MYEAIKKIYIYIYIYGHLSHDKWPDGVIRWFICTVECTVALIVQLHSLGKDIVNNWACNIHLHC